MILDLLQGESKKVLEKILKKKASFIANPDEVCQHFVSKKSGKDIQAQLVNEIISLETTS